MTSPDHTAGDTAAELIEESEGQTAQPLPRSFGPSIALVSSLLVLAATAFVARRVRRRLSVSG